MIEARWRAGLAVSRDVDRLGAAFGGPGRGRDAHALDARAQARRSLRVQRREDQRPRRVPAGRGRDDGRAAFGRLPMAGHHDQIEHARSGGDEMGASAASRGIVRAVARATRAAGSVTFNVAVEPFGPPFPQMGECLLDLRHRMGDDRGRQILRHRLPSRSISSSAGLGTPRPGGVVGEVRCRRRRPAFDDRRHHGPGRFDLVCPGEQRRVAEQRVEDERLIGVGRVHHERRPVVEVHVHRPDIETETRDLGREAEHDALVGLDPHRQDVGGHVAGRLSEESQRHVLELDGDLGGSPGQSFAGSQVEGDSAPAPVVDRESAGDECLGLRFGIDLRLLPVTGNGLGFHPVRAVLPAHHVVPHLLRVGRPDGPQHRPASGRAARPPGTKTAAPWPQASSAGEGGSAGCRGWRRSLHRTSRGLPPRSTPPR